MSEPAQGMPQHNQDQPSDDILELDSPVNRHRTFGRLGLIFLGSGVALFLMSLLLVSTLAAGNLLDLVVLVLWLASAALVIGGLGLVAAAGISAVTRKPASDSPV